MKTHHESFFNDDNICSISFLMCVVLICVVLMAVVLMCVVLMREAEFSRCGYVIELVLKTEAMLVRCAECVPMKNSRLAVTMLY